MAYRAHQTCEGQSEPSVLRVCFCVTAKLQDCPRNTSYRERKHELISDYLRDNFVQVRFVFRSRSLPGIANSFANTWMCDREISR